jgi:hypothetical protein
MTVRVSLCGLSILAYVAMGVVPAAAQSVDFGDDSSIWAMDGECDDPRFMGDGMAGDPQEADILADASDCSAAFEAGTITLNPDMANADVPADRPGKPGTEPVEEPVADTGEVDFGADTSAWVNDGECDDPRFVGQGMAAQPQEADIMADASDCRALFEAGSITLAGGDAPMPEPGPETGGDVDFGADTSAWINDGECDDPRFVGQGMAAQPQEADIMADASDCRALFEAGSITLAGGDGPTPGPTGDVDFGADSGQWTNDGECDDPRFEGEGMADVLLDEDRFADATDCRTLYEAGSIRLIGAGGDTQPVDDGEIDFGADSGQWTNDGECDDPRFQGEGSADVLLDEDRFADATDCRTLYDAGMVEYIGDGSGDGLDSTGIDFGTDSGQWTNDGECDDPRFQGNGMAAVLVDADRLADATDCRTLFDAGQITYIGD